MKDSPNSEDIYKSRDKQICPFLLTQTDVSFVGVVKEGPYVIFRFTPANKCEELVNRFLSRRAPLVQPKDLLDSVESYRDRVFEMKDKYYGGRTF